MLDVHRLRILLEFAARGTITATAAALGYTPSAVSQQLAALERETGAALLDRTARTAELTEAGQRLAAHAAEILARIEAAEADLASPEPVGRVTISAFPTAAVAFAPTLTRTVRAHPGLSLLLRQTIGGEVLQLVRAGQVDVGIVDDWTGLLTAGQPGLRLYPLLTDSLALVLPRGHWAADERAPVSLFRLRDEQWLATPAGEASRPRRRSSTGWPRFSAWWRAVSVSRCCRGSRWPAATPGWWCETCPARARPGTCTRSPDPRRRVGPLSRSSPRR